MGIDEFAYHNKMYFTTPDIDNDNNGGNCADKNKSGWWFNPVILLTSISSQ